MNRKFLLFGFILILLLAIPLTVFVLQQQTHTQQHAAASTSLSFSTTATQVSVGQTFSVDVSIAPGTNQVSFVKLNISYDGTKMATSGAGITPNPTLNLVTLDGPTYGQCSGNNCFITVTYSIGADPTKAITSQSVLASISFKAVAATDNGSTSLGFSNGTQVLSLANNDQPSENVLSSSNGTQLTIVAPSGIPTPTTGDTGGGGSSTPAAATPTPGGTGGGGTSSQPPICTNLLADRNSSASAPLVVLFTVNGSSPVTSISKVSFNFGDGAVQDITSAGGIGTATVNAQVSHSYQNQGSFTATASLTDANGNISVPETCKQVITIGTITPQTQQTIATATPTPMKALPATGPGQTIMIAGGVGAIIAVLGGLLFFGL